MTVWVYYYLFLIINSNTQPKIVWVAPQHIAKTSVVI